MALKPPPGRRVASAAAVPSADAAPMDRLGLGADHTQVEGLWQGHLIPYLHLGRGPFLHGGGDQGHQADGGQAEH